MPTIEENRQMWAESHDWSHRGEEWSLVWGSSAAQWQGSILPRLVDFLPARRALEIGSGHGRWSRLLRPHCQELILVDLVEPCVAACRAEFADDPAVSCARTDGRTLPGVPERSLDFVFSLDSLVHAEMDVLAAYASELARTLAPDGVAFLHHSNMARVLADHPGTQIRHWRGETVSAEGVREAALRAGLVCPTQEVIDWGGVEECDCLSVVARPGSVWDREPLVLRNPFFMGEAQSVAIRSRLYGGARSLRSPS